MIGAGAFRREQEENQIDRLAVERLEIDRTIEPRKQPEQARQMRHLAVRYGDAIADGGRAQLLPLHQRFEDRALVLAGQHSGARGNLLQRLLLVVDFERRKDRVRGDQINERHRWDLKR